MIIEPEGPQRQDLAEDVAAALEAHPQAAAFFDSLAQFYRRAYLRWIDATKRQPDQRPPTDRRDDPTPGGRAEGTAAPVT
ncbi:YdeI/OmpD-associated family protein [Micromonospora sp. ATA32]|nr:YdeI/OmpD-associated family protein [Micromonospora sp. ATA32]